MTDTIASSVDSSPSGARTRWPVAVLGATGAVGQTFVRLLAAHPWFDLVEVAASSRSSGRTYREATRWLEGQLPTSVRELRVLDCDPSQVTAPIVFSALDSSVAGDVEASFARAGRFVLSNAKNYRMDPLVPLVIPEVNGEHLALLEAQRSARGWEGAIVCNANCAVTVAAVALAPLHEQFGVRTVFFSSMQAVSGAGYPGVASLDILGNVIPFISGEEEKIEPELRKILGRRQGSEVIDAPIAVSAHTNRVPVEHGHTVCMSIGFESKVSVEDAERALRNWRGSAAARRLPTAPDRPLVVADQEDRPQPRRDVLAGEGQTVTVGRIRADNILHIKLVALGHNTIRGAAGGSILNAELLATMGAFSRA
jgi:aspartate-semialdehyde dehydrogenase